MNHKQVKTRGRNFYNYIKHAISAFADANPVASLYCNNDLRGNYMRAILNSMDTYITVPLACERILKMYQETKERMSWVDGITLLIPYVYDELIAYGVIDVSSGGQRAIAIEALDEVMMDYILYALEDEAE